MLYLFRHANSVSYLHPQSAALLALNMLDLLLRLPPHLVSVTAINLIVFVDLGYALHTLEGF